MNVVVKTGFSKSRIESFYRFHIKYVSNGRFIELGLILVCSIIGIIGVFLIKEVLVTIIALLIAFVIIGTYNWRVYYSIKRYLRNNPMDSRTYTVIMKDDGVTFIEDNKISEYKWEQIKSVREIDVCYYLYINEIQAIIVPKYTISAKDKEELLKVFQTKSFFKRYKFLSSVEEDDVV